MGRFKKGLFLGTLLGAGLVWLNGTKKGKQTRGQILKHAEKIYPEVKKKVLSSRSWKSMTRSKYLTLVRKHVDAYAKKYALPPAVKNMIVKVVSAQWKHVKEALDLKKKK